MEHRLETDISIKISQGQGQALPVINHHLGEESRKVATEAIAPQLREGRRLLLAMVAIHTDLVDPLRAQEQAQCPDLDQVLPSPVRSGVCL